MCICTISMDKWAIMNFGGSSAIHTWKLWNDLGFNVL